MVLIFNTHTRKPQIVFENEKALKSLEFSSRANQTSDGSGLKVDGNRLKCLLLLEELTAFVVQYLDSLWIRGLEFLKEKSFNSVGAVGSGTLVIFKIVNFFCLQAKMRFVELVYVLATEEAERIGVDHVARVSAGDSHEGSMG